MSEAISRVGKAARIISSVIPFFSNSVGISPRITPGQFGANRIYSSNSKLTPAWKADALKIILVARSFKSSLLVIVDGKPNPLL
jgi:hypothetical protein